MNCVAITATNNFKIINFNKNQLAKRIVEIYPDINVHISIEAALKSSIFQDYTTKHQV